MSTGFPVSEYKARLEKAQAQMASAGLAALLLTQEPDVRYFSGFSTRFWESPTRPWFLIVPASGKPIAVIPAIGAALMADTWIEDIRTWCAPDYEDDGVALLRETLAEVAGTQGPVGIPSGLGTHLRMPLADFHRLRGGMDLVGDRRIVANLRQIKSAAEVEKIATACGIASRAFDRLGEIAKPGISLADVFRAFQILCLQEGADSVPYLAGGAGPLGYADVISPAGAQQLAAGDVLMLDTGLVHDGYFCDFDRNVSLGPAANAAMVAHERLITATTAGFDAARPGATAADVFHAMNAHLSSSDGGGSGAGAGRLGHGLGMQLTEGLSLIPDDHTVLEPGMVLTLEPGIETAKNCLMVHEEDIVITETGAQYLTGPTPARLRSLSP